jgi:hypothetical protein
MQLSCKDYIFRRLADEERQARYNESGRNEGRNSTVDIKGITGI